MFLIFASGFLIKQCAWLLPYHLPATFNRQKNIVKNLSNSKNSIVISFSNQNFKQMGKVMSLVNTTPGGFVRCPVHDLHCFGKVELDTCRPLNHV